MGRKRERRRERKIRGRGRKIGWREGRNMEKEKGRWKKNSLRNVGRTDTKVALYSVQCYALHWTDKT